MKNLLKSFAELFYNNGFVMQFIPIILILLYTTKPFEFSKISNSMVGKIFAITLILYYTRMNKKFGLVAVIVIMVYYRVSEIEGFKSEEEEKKESIEDDGTNLPDLVEEDSTDLPDLVEETFVSKPEPSIITIDNFNDAREQFVKEKCKHGVLMYKMMPVRDEMADHVYSEIKFINDKKCNPCSATCKYNIIEAKMKTEESLVPKMSRF